MRLALALAALAVAAVPGRAADMPSSDDQDTIRAYFGAVVVDKFCPGYRLNPFQLSKLLQERNLPKEDIFDRYKAFSHTTTDEIGKWFEAQPQQACDYFEGYLGEHGRFPFLIERR